MNINTMSVKTEVYAATDLKSYALWRYAVILEKLCRQELGEYFTYGIQIQTPECTYILHDISVCNKTVQHIVDLLNRFQPSPVHLYDIITDLLP